MKPLTYIELCESAKDRVRDRTRYSPDYPEDGWDEFILEEWVEKLAAAGFTDAKIHYSGFCCQGDGACFTSGITDSKLQPPPELLAQIQAAATPVLVHGLLIDDPYFRSHSIEDLIADWTPLVSARITTSGRYSHEMSMDLDFEVQTVGRGNDDHLPTEIATAVSTWLDTIEKDLLEEARDLAREIYSDLNDAYDSEMSDDQLDEILSNRDDFYNFDGEDWEDHMAEEEEESHLQAA